ncbi:penicillin-binding protein 1C [candidate division KSB1 bacterium]|nr:penicillin-binding protein 1C [candidate division KSB1 bacterium]
MPEFKITPHFILKLLKYTIPLFAPILAIVLLWHLFPLRENQLNRKPSTVIFDSDGRILRAYTAPDDAWRFHTPLNEISPLMLKMVLSYEDQWFHWHPGINPVSIIRAVWLNYRAGEIVSGGSTITMQIARMIEPKERSLLSKIKESFRAIQLEFSYSKAELLEIYLNLAPYGGNIEGVGAAAYLYFGKMPGSLSVGEIALLAALPNSPTQLRPDMHTAAARKARLKVLKRLYKMGVISKTQFEDAASEPVPKSRQPIPFDAPHLADYLHQRYAGDSQLHSTIDYKIQKTSESLLQTHIFELKSRGITNGAIVVIENSTRELRALAGSADFFNATHSGQVNGATAPRSPGSALKPFVYALALDQGMISPKSMLEDVPVDYSGYLPENYDDKYHGVVSAEDALRLSLNVPAINLTAMLKEKSLYSLLKSADFSTLNKPREFYGLPIILGACEVTLLELTNLYSSLANGGRFRQVRLVNGMPAQPDKALFSEPTAFIITEILSEVTRPDMPVCWEFSLNLPKVSWKTGTSYGHKDAWSIGYNPEFTIGVWIGNFSGEGAPGLVGAEAAAPLLFELFNALGTGKTSQWFEMPDGIDVRQVCATSGMPATALCPVTCEEMYIPGVSPQQPCTVHQKFIIDDATGYRLCPHCRQNRRWHEEVFELWSPKLATWMLRNGYPIKQIPAHFPKCTSLMGGKGPVIRSPSENCDYVLRDGIHPKYQKILLDAAVTNDIEKIYWFVDGNLICVCSPGEKAFYTPAPGKHNLVCMDEWGRSTKIVLNIR